MLPWFTAYEAGHRTAKAGLPGGANILARLRQRYADSGPTPATEHLAKEGFSVSRETLRKWMDQGGLVAAALPAREKDPRMAGAQSLLR